MSPFVLLVLLPTAILGNRVRCPLRDLPQEDDGSGCCGEDSATRNYITGGTKTIPGQYPWMAGLEYLYRRNYSILCGGSLISGRYVLTAAHCIKDKSLGELHAVRLGEYDITHEGPDCIYYNGHQTCTDGEKTIRIHSYKCHDKYQASWYKAPVHDIALIRLVETVQFTNFIRPICLPKTDINDLGSNIPLYTAGWGYTSNKNNSNNNILRHVDMPVRNINDCLKANFPARDHIVCAGGVSDGDTCKGDSGGPLMMLEDGRYYLVGVTSFGSDKCGKRSPAGFTNVFKYKQWIEEKIRNWRQRYYNSI